MAERIIFRDERGRFIRRAQAEEGFGSVQILDPLANTSRTVSAEEYFAPDVEEEEEARSFWTQHDWERGIVWDDFADDTPSSLGDFAPPDGVDAYRVFANVEGNPDYPRGMASTSWIDSSFWPPSLDMIRGVDATGYNQIRFRRS